MPSIVEEYVQYKVLAHEYEHYGSGTDYVLGMDEKQRETRQICIRLPILTFARLTTVCSFLGDTKQTFGRIGIESSINQAWEALAARSSESANDLQKSFAENLAAEGFFVDEAGWVKPLAKSAEAVEA